MTGPRERRILHAWLPFLPTDRLARERMGSGDCGAVPAADPAPWVTVERVHGALVVAAADRRARAVGLAPGTPLAQARALVPELRVAEAEPGADRTTLVSIARAADRYTPFVALDGADGLFLDIAGCAHLFGGEEGLLGDLAGRLARWGYAARLAVADTPGAAWAVARHGAGGVVPVGGTRAATDPLPAEALRLSPETAAVLARLGLRTVAHVLAQPRAPLVQRFGPLLGRRLDQLAGREAEPIDPLSPVAPFAVERAFAEPLSHMSAIEAALERLARRLSEALRRRGQGARRLRLALFHADGAVREVTVGASEPLDDPVRMTLLVAPRLGALSARVETESGIDLMRLRADEAGPVAPRQHGLDQDRADQGDLAALVDTLSERLGIAAVQRFVHVDTHQPGDADCRLPARDVLRTRSWAAPAEPTGERSPRPPARPLKLFTPPEPVETLASVPDGPPVRFVWRRVSYHVAAAEGPERIAPDWWREAGRHTLDYFRVEDLAGRRFWMFRRGLYAEEGTPRWFLHGLLG